MEREEYLEIEIDRLNARLAAQKEIKRVRRERERSIEVISEVIMMTTTERDAMKVLYEEVAGEQYD